VRLCCANHGANDSNSVWPFEDHRDNWARRDEFHKALEEWALRVHGIVRLSELGAYRRDLEGNDLETALFESSDDAASKLTLYAVWLDENKGALAGAHSSRLADLVRVRFIFARRGPRARWKFDLYILLAAILQPTLHRRSVWNLGASLVLDFYRIGA
jgi:hypothetical protein